ncbi:MAG: IclR family transcriptional regulator [Bryobacteraceae bacterium]
MARRLEQMEPAGRRQEARAGHSRSLSGGTPGKASVPAIERAFVILELLAHSRAGLTLRDVVRATSLPKSSVYCILTTLQRHGYLHRNERTSRYLFGLKLFSLANSALSGLPLREQAEPFLRSLMMQTRLTVHMGIKEREEVVLVAKTEPPGISRLATWIGKRMEVHCTALGKALLAFLPEEEVDRVLQAHNLPRHNENTISSVRRLKEDLARVRTRGYAIDDEEDEIGLRQRFRNHKLLTR